MDRERLAINITSNVATDDQPALVTLINTAYKVGEAGIIVDTEDQPFNRVNIDDVVQMVEAGHLLVARLKGDDVGRIVGCVKIVPDVNGTKDGFGEWGCLAVAVEEQGKGVGSQLVDAAEEALRAAGCQTIQLELLTPIMWVQEHKERLRMRYTEKLGYALKSGDFDTSTTTFEEGALLFGRFTLATDAGFTVYTRTLV